MSRSRTWSVRLSVDDLNASFCLLESDQEIASWVRGLMRGLNGGEPKDGASKQYSEGWGIGESARNKADEIRALCAEVGRVGGAKRVANAQANASQDTTPVGSPPAQPERRTNNVELQEQETRERKKKFVPPTLEAATEYANEIEFRGIAQWFDHYQSNGWMVGKNKMKDWKAAIRYWKNKDGAAFAAPTIQEWMQEGEYFALSNRPRSGNPWPRDLCQSAYYAAAATAWRGVTDWRDKLRAECLRWVGNENGRAR